MNFFKLRSTFWTGPTGKALRRFGPEVRELATYLMSCEVATVVGVYHLELEMVCLQTGRTDRTVRNSFEKLAALDYAFYEETSGWVWVREMAATQLDAPLKAADYRAKMVARWYAAAPRNCWLGPFWDRYRLDLRLEESGIERREYARPELAPALPLGAPGTPDLVLAPPETKTFVARAHRETVLQLFEAVWAVYPKKHRRKEALAAFTALRPTPELVQTILAALQWQIELHEWTKENGTYVPRLEHYLAGERWTDEPPRRTPTLQGRAKMIVDAAEEFISAGADACSTPRTNVPPLPLPLPVSPLPSPPSPAPPTSGKRSSGSIGKR